MEFDDAQDSKKKMLIFIGIGAGVFLLVIIIVVVLVMNSGGEDQPTQPGTEETGEQPGEGGGSGGDTASGSGGSSGDQTETSDSDGTPDGEREVRRPVAVREEVIRTVGEEKIYGGDVIEETERYAGTVDEEVQRQIIEKIETDSIILQAAEAEGLIELSDEVYNSAEKDYTQRIALVEEAKEAVEAEANHIKGVVISIWFVNDVVGPLGYDKAKEVAREKISDVYADVKNGDITIQEAGERLLNDESLADIDEAYELNVMYEFDVYQNKPITVSDEFNEALWELDEGELSQIYTLQDKLLETSETVDAIYAFGQVTEKQTESDITNFDEWLEEKREEYGEKE